MVPMTYDHQKANRNALLKLKASAIHKKAKNRSSYVFEQDGTWITGGGMLGAEKIKEEKPVDDIKKKWLSLNLKRKLIED